MRTFDDTFSGQKIYPGKVRKSPLPRPAHREGVHLSIRTTRPLRMPCVMILEDMDMCEGSMDGKDRLGMSYGVEK
jgi:hypothetical protein